MMSDPEKRYLDTLTGLLTSARATTRDARAKAVAAILRAVRADGQVYVFGTGHSHMLAEEVHYRAGGLAAVVPVLSAATMLHEGAVSGSALERTPGLILPILDRYGIEARDVLLVISNSGVNAAPVEAARYGKAHGATVIALTSLAYSAAAARGRERLADIADIVIDNGIPAGDAVASLPGTGLRAGPASTVIGAALINAIMVDVATELAADGTPPIYLSANMPGAEENNRHLVAKYRPRNPHL